MSNEYQLKERGLKTYIAVLVVFAATLAITWFYQYGMSFEPRFALGAVFFVVLILAGDAFPIRVTERVTIGTWDVALIFAVVVLGPFWAAFAALPSAFFVGRRNLLRTAYEIGHTVTITYLAGMVFYFISGPLISSDPESFIPALYGTIISGVTLLGANKMINGGLLKIKYDQSFHETWRGLTEPYLLSDLVSILTAGLGVVALLLYGPVAAVVAVGGSIGSQVLVYRSREQVREIRELKERVGSLEESLTTSNTGFGMMIIRELGNRDGYTDRHAAATAAYATDLGREMKINEVRARWLRMAALVHNVGMFGLPDELLTATGRLNSIAKSQIAEHPVRSQEALAAVPEFREMASWVRWHHERPDGRGYPDKLRGRWIPLEAKILGLAQAYAAMVLDQPRRPGISSESARREISTCIDTKFDGMVVRAFLRILDTETEGYRMADDSRFVFPAPEEVSGTLGEAFDQTLKLTNADGTAPEELPQRQSQPPRG